MQDVKSRMQGYKPPAPAPVEMPDAKPKPSPAPAAVSTPADVAESAPGPELDSRIFRPTEDDNGAEPDLTGGLSRKLLARFTHTNDFESTRYRAKPWRQLPDETALEYALFGEFLFPALAKGRDIDELAKRLNDPLLQDWYTRLLNTCSIPKYIVEGPEVKKRPKKKGKSEPEDEVYKTNEDGEIEVPRDREVETRLLWWVAERNLWLERGRLYDAWQMSTLAEQRRLQIRSLAQQIDKYHIEHVYAMTGLLQTTRDGLLRGVTQNNGQFTRLQEEHEIPARGPIFDDKTGQMISPAVPHHITRTLEWDPFAQLQALERISDRLFGPLSHMLDGDLATILDQSLTVPVAPLNADGSVAETGEIGGRIPESKRGNATWLMERLGKVQEDMDQRKARQPEELLLEGGENVKPKGA